MPVVSVEMPTTQKSVGSARPYDRRGKPLYIVCSPSRGVGKTLVSRLLAEMHFIDNVPVTAFDLADEGPQMADFLPETTAVSDIGSIMGQMEFFEKLVADNSSVKVIDLSHRVFKNFFLVVDKIAFFEEARKHAIEPVILFLVDQDPKSVKAYGILRRWFSDVALIPVRNHKVASGVRYIESFPMSSAVPLSVEIPVLSPSLTALVDQQSFSFLQFWNRSIERMPERLDDDLRHWMKRVLLHFRQIELCVMCDGILNSIFSKKTPEGELEQDAPVLPPSIPLAQA
jgi:hypothetical protein